MKKFLSILALALIAFTINAQSYQKMYQGVGADTIIASQTLSKVINVNSNNVQTVSVQILIDSVSGTPSGTATLYKSLDGTNYVTTGQSATWVSGVDSLFVLTDTSFYGVYLKTSIVTTATAQKSNVTATLKSWNK